jgi:hypothetical protein
MESQTNTSLQPSIPSNSTRFSDTPTNYQIRPGNANFREPSPLPTGTSTHSFISAVSGSIFKPLCQLPFHKLPTYGTAHESTAAYKPIQCTYLTQPPNVSKTFPQKHKKNQHEQKKVSKSRRTAQQ